MTCPELPLQCDECQCIATKIHRIHKGRRYCNTCYVRLFKRRLCPGCGNFGRLPIFEKSAQCIRCESRAPCVRCNKTGKPVGVMTLYGPACASCAHHFSEPEPCERCGRLSTKLTRVLAIDPDVRCCSQCARKGGATCPGCRRHRFLIRGEDGRMRCKLCTEKGEVACATCNGLMPAGRNNECENCAWEKSLDRRVHIHVETFDNASTRLHFDEFCRWLKSEMGAHKAALKLKHYVPFFSFLDAHPAGLPSYVSLLENFGAEGLRRMQTPMLWLNTRYGVAADEQLRKEHSEKRRIQEMIQSTPTGVCLDALLGYWAYLRAKQADGSTSISSVRLSLRAAKNMLASASKLFDTLPTQQMVTAYLTQTPGQRAAAHGFIGYLNRTHTLSLTTEVSERAVARAKIHKLEAKLYALYAKGGEGEVFERTWIKHALMLVHRVKNVNKKTLAYSVLTQQGVDGFSVALNAKVYWVPGPSSAPSLVTQPQEMPGGDSDV